MTLPARVRPVAAALAALVLVLCTAAPARADRIRDREWWLGPLKVTQAQRITKGAGVTVAVVDSGVNAGHPDLQGAVLTGRDMVSGKNGHFDAEGHGTAMAGIIAARGRGGAGFLGIAPAAKVLPVTPSDVTMYVTAGIRWATAHGAKVINMSFAIVPSDNMHAAIREAAAADIVLVAAAGNNGNTDNKAEYPSSYPEVLAVGADRPQRQGAAAVSSRAAGRSRRSGPGHAAAGVRQGLPGGQRHQRRDRHRLRRGGADPRAAPGAQRGPGGADPHRDGHRPGTRRGGTTTTATAS